MVIHLSPFYYPYSLVLYPYIQEDDTMTKQELLISHINRLSEDEISSLLDAVTIILQDKEFTPKPACPHCAAQSSDTSLSTKSNVFSAKIVGTHLCLLQIP